MSRTILIVEPHASVAVLLDRILTTSDWTTHVCDDAGAAVAYVGRHRVDAVLCDYSTELITGTNLRELRDSFEPTPLVLTSTWDKAAEIAAAMKVLFLKKPFNLEDVEVIVRRAMMLDGLSYTVDQSVMLLGGTLCSRTSGAPPRRNPPISADKARIRLDGREDR